MVIIMNAQIPVRMHFICQLNDEGMDALPSRPSRIRFSVTKNNGSLNISLPTHEKKALLHKQRTKHNKRSPQPPFVAVHGITNSFLCSSHVTSDLCVSVSVRVCVCACVCVSVRVSVCVCCS